jgi:hypothetical protein
MNLEELKVYQLLLEIVDESEVISVKHNNYIDVIGKFSVKNNS